MGKVMIYFTTALMFSFFFSFHCVITARSVSSSHPGIISRIFMMILHHMWNIILQRNLQSEHRFSIVTFQATGHKQLEILYLKFDHWCTKAVNEASNFFLSASIREFWTKLHDFRWRPLYPIVFFFLNFHIYFNVNLSAKDFWGVGVAFGVRNPSKVVFRRSYCILQHFLFRTLIFFTNCRTWRKQLCL